MNRTETKVLALVACLVGIPAYVLGCYELAKWACRHMWVQTDPFLSSSVANEHLRSGIQHVRAVLTASNIYWGSALIVTLELAFTVAVLAVVFGDF